MHNFGISINHEIMTRWNLHKCNSPDEVYQILKTDRIWAGYAICDLESPLWERSAFYCVHRGKSCALVLHVDTKSFQVLTAFGITEGVNAAWLQIPLPEKAWISLRTETEMKHFCRFYHVNDLQSMWRLHLPKFSARISAHNYPVTQLGVDRQPEIEILLREHEECAYSPEQLQRGVFFGVEDRGKIVSLVGTHVVSAKYKLAAVGNAFTHPKYRSKGYFRTCLSAVLDRLFSMGITDVVANVIQDNLPSLKGALSVGFKKYCPYWEGIAYRR